jgi:catechol 2,3-dioxygenase-like lactoylglutathione lyase family enzyme
MVRRPSSLIQEGIMTSILGIAEAVLYVEDLPQAREFYTRVLGLSITADYGESCFLQVGPQSCLILFDIRQLEIRESQIPDHGAYGEGHVALAINAADRDTWLQRLQENKVVIEHEQSWPQGTRSIYFRDPHGNSIELIDGHHYQMNAV